MSEPADGHGVDDHFAGKDASVRELYDRLLSVLRKIGPVAEEAKKTSIHLVHASALAAVETRKGYLLLNLKADHRVEGPRVARAEQLSARRVHFQGELSPPGDNHPQLQGWVPPPPEPSG